MFVQVPVIAQYKGKRYNLESDNAQELISKLESEIGISSVSESVALFRGKKLAPEERFEDIGVTPGDVIDITMANSASKSRPVAKTNQKKENSGGFSWDSIFNPSSFSFDKIMSPELLRQSVSQMTSTDITEAKKKVSEMLGNKHFREILSNADKLVITYACCPWLQFV